MGFSSIFRYSLFKLAEGVLDEVQDACILRFQIASSYDGNRESCIEHIELGLADLPFKASAEVFCLAVEHDIVGTFYVVGDLEGGPVVTAKISAAVHCRNSSDVGTGISPFRQIPDFK